LSPKNPNPSNKRSREYQELRHSSPQNIYPAILRTSICYHGLNLSGALRAKQVEGAARRAMHPWDIAGKWDHNGTTLCVISSMPRRVEETLARGADFDERFPPVTRDFSGCEALETHASWLVAEILNHPVEQVGKLIV
jgi:hypothetical protein